MERNIGLCQDAIPWIAVTLAAIVSLSGTLSLISADSRINKIELAPANN
jgi:hypothetical protein